MNIEEILKSAGIEDADTVAKVKEAMPKAYMPLGEANKRISAAKQEAEQSAKALEDFKAEAEAAAQAAADKAAGDESETAKALAELQKQFEQLQGDYSASQTELRNGRARTALEKALTDAGANPAALSLLAGAGMGRVEFGEDGKPSNIAEAVEAVKAENGGLFGTQIDTGQQQKKGDPAGNEGDDFLKGFGSTEKN